MFLLPGFTAKNSMDGRTLFYRRVAKRLQSTLLIACNRVEPQRPRVSIRPGGAYVSCEFTVEGCQSVDDGGGGWGNSSTGGPNESRMPVDWTELCLNNCYYEADKCLSSGRQGCLTDYNRCEAGCTWLFS